jgi:hypothetical protein
MGDAQYIRRAPHNAENPFASISRVMLQDKTLSYEARGLLGYLLSKSGDWEVRIKDLQIKGTGRDKVYRILDELQVKGYIGPRVPFQDEKGHWRWPPYEVYETLDQNPHPRPYPEKPYTGKPNTVQPNTENTEVYIKETHEKKKTKEDSASDDAQSPVEPSNESISVKAAVEETPPAKPTRKRSAKQIALDEAMEKLAKAKRVTLMPHDYTSYSEVASTLIANTIEASEFERYVARLRRTAPSQSWDVDKSSVYALIAKERITEYVTARNAWLSEQASNPQDQWSGDDAPTVPYHQSYTPTNPSTPLSDEQRAEAVRQTQAGLDAMRAKKAKAAS